MAEPFYVYVAGPLSGDPGQYLANVCCLSRAARRLMAAGYVVINPAGDLVEGLCSPEPLSVAAYQARSMALLELLAYAPKGRRAVYVDRIRRSDGSRSGGVEREIQRALALQIPVFWQAGGEC